MVLGHRGKFVFYLFTNRSCSKAFFIFRGGNDAKLDLGEILWELD
jgi:hypothetical protein